MTTQPIDIMNYAPFVAPGLSGPEFQYEEFQIMVQRTVRMPVNDGKVRTLWGREVPLDGTGEVDPTVDIQEVLRKMDDVGYDKVVVVPLKMWSYWYHHQLIQDDPIEPVAEAVAKGGGRIIGAASYNPLRIEDSLKEIDRAVHDFGFRYVYFHPMTFGVAPNDRRCYPLYAKCNELGIPVGLQVGHSAEVLPAYHGRPYLVEDVAIEFPNLKINMSHTGWPWTGEFCSMVWRHPNVYGDISAYFAGGLDAELVNFMGGRGRHKVLFGTNGLDPARALKEFNALEIRDEAKELILRTNAEEFLGL